MVWWNGLTPDGSGLLAPRLSATVCADGGFMAAAGWPWASECWTRH